jgi:hypothetical protein
MDAARKTTTAEAWRERIDAQRASGESIRAWCRQNGCHEHSFYWWRARLGLAAGSPKRRRAPAKPVKFAEVIVGPATAGETMTLRLRGGNDLILPAAMPVERLVQIVRAIEGAA